MMVKYIKTYESFTSSSKKTLKLFYKGLRQEISENTEMRKILVRYASGQKPSKDEISFIKEQSGDILKMLGLGAVVMLPGASLLIPALIIGAKKVGIDILPSGFKKIDETMSEEEIVNIIQDGKKIYVNYINGLPNHNKELGYAPVDINDGEITLDIDGKNYSTQLKWVIGIDEVSHYEVEPHMTEPMEDPSGKIEDHHKRDVEFQELLKDQGGIKGIKKKMKRKYNLDYSDIDTEDKLFQQLKADNML